MISVLERDIVYTNQDTTKIRLLIELVDSIHDEKSWQRFNNQAFELGKRLSNDKNPTIQTVGKTYLADAINNNGYAKFNQGDNTGALIDYFESLKIREELGYQRGIASSYNNIGSVFQKQGELNRALDYFQKSYDLRVQNGEKGGIAQSLNHIGEIHKIKKDFDTALDYMQQSLVSFRNIGAVAGEAEVLQDISEVYILEGKYDLARSNIEESIYHFNQINSTHGLLGSSVMLGKIEIELKHYQEAIKIGIKSLKIAEKNEFIDSKIYIYELLNKAYEAVGNAPMAYRFYKAHIELRDSLSNPKTQNNVLEQEFQYENGKKEAERLAEQERKDTRAQNIRNTLLASCLVLFLFAGVLINRNYIRKIANEELAEKNAIIEQEKQRAEESEHFKSQFLSNISHEIRTPMNAILGMSDLLSNTKINTQQSTYVNAIKKSSENLLLIINDVLDFSKLEAGKVELESIPFKPADVIEDVYNTLKFKAEEKGLEFKIVIDEQTAPILMGDNFRLYQILMNLVGNAIKFTEKGSVSIEIEVMQDNSNKQMIRYLVRDTGIGIDAEKIASIFNSFQQAEHDTARRFGGTGLGLSISQQLVKLRNSEIKVQSEVGLGSVFYFDIAYPIASEEDFSKYDAEHHQVEPSDFKNLRILLAEDNEYNQIVAVESLIRHLKHCEIQVANNGNEVITLLERNEYDVILMDLNMPEMNGYEATEIIRNDFDAKKSQTPIIALTAFAFEEETRALEAGMNAYITKPFKINNLLNIIAKLLNTKSEAKEVSGSISSTNEFIECKILDLRFIQEFTENDMEQMKHFIDKFIKNAPKEMSTIVKTLENEDYDKIRKAAHTFKPQIEFVGIKAAIPAIIELEKAAEEKLPITTLHQRFSALELAVNEGVTALQTIL